MSSPALGGRPESPNPPAQEDVTASDGPIPSRSGSSGDHGTARSVLWVLERSGLPLILVAVLGFLAVDPRTSALFYGSANIVNLLGSQSVVGLVALGAVLPMVAGSFDLSVGAVAGFSSVATAAALGPGHLGLPLAVVLGIVSGAAFGVFNGLLIAGARLNAFIVTLGVSTILPGLTLAYTQGNLVSSVNRPFINFGTGNLVSIPYTLFPLIVVAGLVWYFLRYTPPGRYLHAIGSNMEAARLVGIPATRMVFLTFVLSGTLAGTAGVIQVARSGSADATTGPGFLFPALTAVFLGATSIQPGRYNVIGTMVGVFFLGVSESGLALLGASSWVTPVFQGAALLVAVALARLLAQRERYSTA